MEWEQACKDFVQAYLDRSNLESEIASRDLSDAESRKSSERELFEKNAEVVKAAKNVEGALRQLFESRRTASLPRCLADLAGGDIAPYRDKVKAILGSLETLAAH